MNIIMNILAGLVAIVIIAALIPFGAAVLVLCALLAIAGIIATVVTGRPCFVYKSTRTRTWEEDGQHKTRTIITTNMGGKTTTKVVES